VGLEAALCSQAHQLLGSCNDVLPPAVVEGYGDVQRGALLRGFHHPAPMAMLRQCHVSGWRAARLRIAVAARNKGTAPLLMPVAGYAAGRQEMPFAHSITMGGRTNVVRVVGICSSRQNDSLDGYLECG
jgi:hypothetical protein